MRIAKYLILALLGLASGQGTARADETRRVSEILTPFADPTDDWRVWTTWTNRTITIYGQISQALLGYDDGRSSRLYAPVDNSNASTRVGLTWQLPAPFGLASMLHAEVGVTPRPSSSMSQTYSSGTGFSLDGTNIRKLELVIKGARLGTVSVGQGSMATDGIAEIDLSRTNVAAYSAVSQPAGGQFLRRKNGTLSSIRIGDIFNNFDGDNVTGYNSDGSRNMRVRYDTPSYRGFRVAVAGGTDAIGSSGNEYVDAALRYELATGDYKAQFGLGYSRKGSERISSGSASVLHRASGVTVTVAAGNSNESGTYRYLKVGVIRDILPIGNTAISLDYYDGAELTGPASRSQSVGLAVSQEITDSNVEIFGLLRSYRFDDRISDYETSTMLFSGLRWRF